MTISDKLLSEIADEVMQGDQGSTSGVETYDLWGNPERSNKYHQLKYHLYDKGVNGFKVNNNVFVIEFKRSNGITNMGGTPDTIMVRLLVLWAEKDGE